MAHLRVAFHIPGRRLTQPDLDNALEAIERMACGLGKSGRPIFLVLDNKPFRTCEEKPDDVDFVVKLMGTERNK